MHEIRSQYPLTEGAIDTSLLFVENIKLATLQTFLNSAHDLARKKYQHHNSDYFHCCELLLYPFVMHGTIWTNNKALEYKACYEKISLLISYNLYLISYTNASPEVPVDYFLTQNWLDVNVTTDSITGNEYCRNNDLIVSFIAQVGREKFSQ